jgi:hypothetical protein
MLRKLRKVLPGMGRDETGPEVVDWHDSGDAGEEMSRF